MFSTLTFFLSFVGGILPALFWLWFWLGEDRLHPEPRELLIKTFLAGMIATLIALTLENGVRAYFPGFSTLSANFWSIPLVAVLATIEEVCKYSAAYFAALKRRENDEPIDNMIYLITAALGFVAMENAFFLLSPIQNGNVLDSFITGDLRFIGSSLLHVISSSVIGILMAFAFCKLPSIKKTYTIIGVILAILLHSLFNFFILMSNDNLFPVFGFVWVGVIVLLLLFERAKRINSSCVY